MSQEEEIKKHYEIALNLIKLNQLEKAKKELFNKMPIELYDLSLDIMDNRNLINRNIELRKLITEVHNKLEPIELDRESDIQDNFINI